MSFDRCVLFKCGINTVEQHSASKREILSHVVTWRSLDNAMPSETQPQQSKGPVVSCVGSKHVKHRVEKWPPEAGMGKGEMWSKSTSDRRTEFKRSSVPGVTRANSNRMPAWALLRVGATCSHYKNKQTLNTRGHAQTN